MFLQLKLRFGATLMIVGGIIAASGEVINAQTTDVLNSSWHLSLNLIIVGTLLLIIGLSVFTSVSELINGAGYVGSILLFIGGLLLIVGTVVLDWILLPFLINLSNTISSMINGPATATQHKLNTIISNLNGSGDPFLQKLFPGLTPHIPAVHIPEANGTAMVNQSLVQLHIPTIDRLAWWGHFSFTGGTLIIGCLILGLALLHKYRIPVSTGTLLVVFALLNLVCQLFTLLPPYFANITSILLFLTLAWLASSAWRSNPATLKEY